MSNERRVGSNADNSVSTLNTEEPVIRSYFCNSVDADNLAKGGIVETNFIQNYESVGDVATESQTGEASDD